jgi:hypothetical protein
MSAPPSPTMPGLVSLREVPALPSIVSLEDLPSPAELVTAVASVDHSALVKIITDAVAQKPTSVAEALQLISSLQGKIAEWVVSELPEKDKVLAGLKMVESVAASVGCLPCLRK